MNAVSEIINNRRKLKMFGHIPRYVASLDGQMPHPLEL